MFSTMRSSVIAIATVIAGAACTSAPKAVAVKSPTASEPAMDDSSSQSLADGKKVFRDDTFGDEQFWTDTLHLNEVVEKAVDPTTALKVGLKVDADVLPPGILKKADLKSPATTIALLKMNAIVGVRATVDSNNHITRLGITCAFCHSTVDNSVMPGIGHRMDGWPNRQLNVGAIIALSPALTPEQKAVYGGWGPGKYDPRYNIDGKNAAIMIPPAYGLANIKNETYTAEGPISYWNAYVAVTQMHGHGTFIDKRIAVDIEQTPDMVASKLPSLRAYQHSIAAPAPPAGTFAADAADRGRKVFDGSCASCHVDANGTDNNSNNVLHKAAETGMDDAYAARTAMKRYRTTPLRALWQHAPYFHDGSAATLEAVVAHYDSVRKLGLTAAQKHDLVEYLKSL